jgi:hypothetical protein
MAKENQFVRLWDSPKVDAVLVEESIKANPTKVTSSMEGLSNLSMRDRIDKAYGQISFGIHPTQEPAFIRAYEVGTKEGRSYLTYTKEDLRQKVKILQEAGFDDQDIESLMKKGFLGTTEKASVKAKPESPVLKAHEQSQVDSEVEKLISANAKDTPALIVNYSKDPEYAPLFKAEKMYPDQNRDIAIVIRDMEVKNPQMKPSEIRKEVEGLINTCELK